MWKLPSPSVICAQNSPVIFTTGFTLVRSTSIAIHPLPRGVQGARDNPCPTCARASCRTRCGVAQNLVALEFRLEPIRRALLDFERIAIPQVVAEPIDHFAEHAIRLALVHFERTNLVDQVVDHIAQMHGIQHAEAEVDSELQPGLAGSRLDSVAVFEQQHAEAIEAGIFQREAILRLIHAEAARAAGAGGEENVVIQNLVARHPFFLQELEILHQVAHGEISRIALAVVAELFAGLEGGDIGHGQFFAAVAAALKDGANQIFVLPGEAAEQNRDLSRSSAVNARSTGR